MAADAFRANPTSRSFSTSNPTQSVRQESEVANACKQIQQFYLERTLGTITTWHRCVFRVLFQSREGLPLLLRPEAQRRQEAERRTRRLRASLEPISRTR